MSKIGILFVSAVWALDIGVSLDRFVHGEEMDQEEDADKPVQG